MKGGSERERARERKRERDKMASRVSSPHTHTPSAQDGECSFISVCERRPAGRAGLSVY